MSDRDYLEFDTFPSEFAAAAAAASLGAAGIDCVVERIDAGAASMTRVPQAARLLVSRGDIMRARAAVEAAAADHQVAIENSLADWRTIPRDVLDAGRREIRRRRRMVWAVGLSYLPAGVLAFLYSPARAGYVIAVWMLAFIASAAWAAMARCPGCARTYSVRRRARNPWTQRCMHCELPLRGEGD
jgi:hypothetical protein